MPLAISPAQHAVAEADSAFAADLYTRLSARPGNITLSPYSVASALRMTAYGARGRTAEEMARALHLDGLDRAVSGSGEIAERLRQSRQRDVELEVADTVWVQSGLRIDDDFVAALRDGHEATLRQTDFRRSPEQARLDINRTVDEATHGHIKDLLGPGAISPLSRLVLTNAIYLKAAWAVPFMAKATRNGPFHPADGSTVDVPMMHATESYGYASTDGVQVVQLPYKGGQLAMTILLPAGPLDRVERRVSHDGLRRLLDGTRPAQIDLTMPRFRVRTNRVLNDDLRALGMVEAFDHERADFSGITSDELLVISHVVHEAYVDVDEKGTEAAAATAVGMRAVSMPIVTARVVVDRPFLFAITEPATGLPLFLGRVADPSQRP